jgi:hypothetical protein
MHGYYSCQGSASIFFRKEKEAVRQRGVSSSVTTNTHASQPSGLPPQSIPSSYNNASAGILCQMWCATCNQPSTVTPDFKALLKSAATPHPCPCWGILFSQTVLGIILGGGAGTRLYPLTKKRAKPAVPLGANYRLIDIPVSNCVNSNVTKIYCLTQFNSASLNRHLSQAYVSGCQGAAGGAAAAAAGSARACACCVGGNVHSSTVSVHCFDLCSAG